MNYNKKDFNKEHKRLRLLEIDGKLDMYSAGRLSLIDNVENLILCGVGVRSEQLCEHNYKPHTHPTFPLDVNKCTKCGRLE